MPSNRCQCHTNKKLVCKKNSTFIIQNKRYCHVHAKQIYNKNIIKIQSLYRSYKCRQKINSLFKPLPREVQDIVLYYFRTSYYIEKFNKSINKIISNRVDKYMGNSEYPQGELHISKNMEITRRHVKFYTDIIDIYNLYTKYSSICNYEYCYRLYGLIRVIWNLYKYQIKNEELLLDDNNNNIILNQDYNDSDLSKALYDSLMDYQLTFNCKFKINGYLTPVKIYLGY